MRIDIYHGSETAVRQPRFGVGRAYNDFGLGFYCTESKEYAAEWAVSSGRNGFVDSLVSKNDELAGLAGDIDKHGISGGCLCHTQFMESLQSLLARV